jgi:nucleoside-diphosphate-sugar epimerase
MKKILVTGALGQVGSELVMKMRNIYGQDNVIATDLKFKECEAATAGPFETLDVTDGKAMSELVSKYKADTIIHLAALLSATAEKDPSLAWNINMGGLKNVLDIGKEQGCSIFTPSSIAAFGPLTPADLTPQDTIQRPSTIYGVTKVAGEVLSDYYHKKFGTLEGFDSQDLYRMKHFQAEELQIMLYTFTTRR